VTPAVLCELSLDLLGEFMKMNVIFSSDIFNFVYLRLGLHVRKYIFINLLQTKNNSSSVCSIFFFNVSITYKLLLKVPTFFIFFIVFSNSCRRM
jgi:hypothetical protein